MDNEERARISVEGGEMRVVLLTREFPPDTLWGGEAVASYDIARILVGIGHEVHVICQAVDGQREKVENGIHIHRVGRNPKRYSLIARIDYSLSAILKLHELMHEYDVNLVEGFYGTSEISLYVLLKSLKIHLKPLLLHAHGSIRHSVLDTRSYNGTIGFVSVRLLVRLADFTARRSDIIIAISPIMVNELISESGVTPSKVRLVLTPRNPTKFRFIQSDIRKSLGLNNEEKIVLSVGRLEFRKGIHVLCQAIPLVRKEHPNVSFVIVGYDTPTSPSKGLSFKGFLLSKVLNRDDVRSVKFVEHVSDEELVALYSVADVVVSPSLSEISTSVPIEAMACGKPVVLTDTGTARLLQIDGSNGLIVPPGNPRKLGEAIVKMLKVSEEDRLAIAKTNREIVQKVFGYSSWASQIKRLHASVAGKRIA